MLRFMGRVVHWASNRAALVPDRLQRNGAEHRFLKESRNAEEGRFG